MVWTVVYHPEAEGELDDIPVLAERVAIVHAVEKLEALGPEAQVNRRGFARAVEAAAVRLNEIET